MARDWKFAERVLVNEYKVEEESRYAWRVLDSAGTTIDSSGTVGNGSDLLTRGELDKLLDSRDFRNLTVEGLGEDAS